MDNKPDEKENLGGRREALKRLGLVSGVVAALVFPVALTGCPLLWANGEETEVTKKKQKPKPE